MLGWVGGEVFGVDECEKFFDEAKKISPDRDDVDYFTLALKFYVGIWSNDKIWGGRRLLGV